MPDPRTVADRSGRIFTVIFVLCVSILSVALYLQHVKNLDPCPWCIVQRLAFISTGLIALVAALHRPGPGGTIFYALIGAATALAGAVTAGYHIHLQGDPKLAAACMGSPVERLLDASKIGQWIPPLLQYDGPCTLKPWDLLGLSIPEWSLVGFVTLIVMFAVTPYLANR
jgi:disulfide bond formation protein DsbB